jgi:phospholipid/cholesterol/gamma-HCH transport system substrate-binding protein
MTADPRVILVRISVDNRFKLTKGSTAQLGYQGVTGLAYVQIEDNGSSIEPLVGAKRRAPSHCIEVPRARHAG